MSWGCREDEGLILRYLVCPIHPHYLYIFFDLSVRTSFTRRLVLAALVIAAATASVLLFALTLFT
jgi:hypothetical protein